MIKKDMTRTGSLTLILLATSALALSGCREKSETQQGFGDWIRSLFDGRFLTAPQYNWGDEHAADNGPYPIETSAGSYLSARFAQSQFDWPAADAYLQTVLALNPGSVDLERRAMVLAMGSGDADKAIALAKILTEAGDTGSLAPIFLSLEKFKKNEYKAVIDDMRAVPSDGISDFVKPLIRAWAMAAEGKSGIEQLNRNIVQFYHAILISDYLNDETALRILATQDFLSLSLSPKSLERIADIFARHGLNEQAKTIYKALNSSKSDRQAAREKLARLTKPDEKSAKEKSFEALLTRPIASPVQGLTQGLFDMASVLHEEYTDSARLFAYMALYLDPGNKDSRILLAQMASDYGRYNEAILQLQQIDGANDPDLEARVKRQISDLLEESGKTDQAISTLQSLVKSRKDVDAQIQIGDIYRRREDYGRALNAYNDAAKMIDGKIPSTQWNLLYARGIAHERLKNYADAERDLKDALSYQPSHPYILNYLAYSWTDRGINLDQALEMLKKASAIRPDDGYIIDSLGWVYYRLGRYTEAASALERAVELMPYDATVNDHLGDAYWRAGRTMEAKFQWKRALSFAEAKPDDDEYKTLIPIIRGKISGEIKPDDAKKPAITKH